MLSKAIVLRTIKYNDESIIANVLTEECGNKSMLVRISRSKRAAVRHTLFQVPSMLYLEWNDRPTADLQRVLSAQPAYPFSSIPYDPYKNAIALFLAEFLYHAIRHEPDTHTIFEYLERSLEWLDTAEQGFSNFHLVFLLRLTRFLGFAPNIRHTSSACYFDLRGSQFTEVQPAHTDFLPPADAAFIPKLMRMGYANMHVFRFNGNERSRLLEYINRYYRLHIPNFPELKSLAILKELFR